MHNSEQEDARIRIYRKIDSSNSVPKLFFENFSLEGEILGGDFRRKDPKISKIGLKVIFVITLNLQK